MTRRQHLLENYGPALRWLSPEDAAAAYREASRYDRRDRYGLSPETVTDIRRDQVRDNDFESLRTWMADATGGVGDVKQNLYIRIAINTILATRLQAVDNLAIQNYVLSQL